MALESWEAIIFQLAIGSLIGGIILFIFSLFTAEFQFGDHDAEVTDFSAETEFSIGHIEVETEVEIDHEIAHDHGDSSVENNPSTPILLIVSTFFLMFGAIGTVIYEAEVFNPIFRLLLTLIVPIIFVKIVSFLWKKYTATEHGYEIPTVTIDNQVKTLTNVDEKGGLVLADTGDLNRPESLHHDDKMKMQAKTLPGTVIERDSVAYVIAIDEKNTLIIDLWPKQAKKINKN